MASYAYYKAHLSSGEQVWIGGFSLSDAHAHAAARYGSQLMGCYYADASEQCTEGAVARFPGMNNKE